MPPLPVCNKWSENLTQFKDCQYCSSQTYRHKVQTVGKVLVTLRRNFQQPLFLMLKSSFDLLFRTRRGDATRRNLRASEAGTAVSSHSGIA